jgi:Tol biopolymer transport system component
MILRPGDRLGPYDLIAAFGDGGWGAVYRARDARLNRDVAIKVLSPSVAQHPERLARFRREAQLLASLNHTNIGAIYGLEEAEGQPFLVLELVDGDDLATRLLSGPLAVDEALLVARQIAEALEAAHDKGIVHRDLKPGNVKVRPDGHVKVLDFGLAKAYAGEATGPGASGELADSPTRAHPGTAAGVILGTASYMAPEQARGREVDKRADIWAFGVVLFEMVTGRRLFTGETLSDVLASVLTRDPDWTRLPPELPRSVRDLLRRCLQRSPRLRLHDIADARIVLDEVIAGVGEPGATPQRRGRPSREQWLLAGLVILAVAVGSLAWAVMRLRSGRQAAAPIRLSLPAPETAALGPGSAVSRDGGSLVFVATHEGTQQLWLRRLSGIEPQPLPDTDGAINPFWSPDGRFVGFFTPNALKAIELATGTVQIVCRLSTVEPLSGGTWSADGVIVFSSDSHSPLFRVPATGGTPTPVPELGTRAGTAAHLWPEFLPDGRHVLFYLVGVEDGIFVIALDSGEKTMLVPHAWRATYASPGFLLFVRDTTLMVQPFDAATARLSGDAVPISAKVDWYFSAADNGVLAYRAGAADVRQLRWFDRTGRDLGKVGPAGDYLEPALSPDGARLALGLGTWTPDGDIWLLELARGSRSRLTSSHANEITPIWSPDGRQIVFASNRNGRFDLFRTDASGAGRDELLFRSDADKFPIDWSRDGKYVIYYTVDPRTKADLWLLPMTGDHTPVPFLQTEYNETNALFSPDARWVAYNSDESGTPEIYVRPFPAAVGRWQVSTHGGVQPVWRNDGRELYYVGLDGKVMAVDVKPGPAFSAGLPVALFDSGLRPEGLTESRSSFAVSADGQRFLVNAIAADAGRVPITVVVNWAADLRK